MNIYSRSDTQIPHILWYPKFRCRDHNSWTLLWVKRIQSMPSQIISRPILILSSHLCVGFTSDLFPSNSVETNIDSWVGPSEKFQALFIIVPRSTESACTSIQQDIDASECDAQGWFPCISTRKSTQSYTTKFKVASRLDPQFYCSMTWHFEEVYRRAFSCSGLCSSNGRSVTADK